MKISKTLENLDENLRIMIEKMDTLGKGELLIMKTIQNMNTVLHQIVEVLIPEDQKKEKEA